MTASANADYFRKLVTDPSGTVDALIPASEVEYVPGGALVSTNVQAALDELEGLSGGAADWGDIGGTLSDQTDLQTALDAKQATLVSSTNLKTINGESLLGSSDIVISGSGLSQAQVLARSFVGC